MIIGEHLMPELGMKIDYHIGSTTWDSMTRLLRSVSTDKNDLRLMREELRHYIDSSKRSVIHCVNTSRNQKALQEAKHLNRKLKLGKVLIRHKDVFDGSLAVTSGCKYHLNLKDDAPRSLKKRFFPVAKCHEKKFKSELDRLMKLKIIKNYMDLTLKEF